METAYCYGLTPFQCMQGYQPPCFTWSGEPFDKSAVDVYHRRRETWEGAQVRLQRAIQRLRSQDNRRPLSARRSWYSFPQQPSP